MRRQICLIVFLVLSVASVASAQQPIPVPTNSVVICGAQEAPSASSYELIFNGGAPEVLTPDASVSALCPAGATHSFTLPPTQFIVGTHTIVIRSINAFGSTDGPSYLVEVGIKPGPFNVLVVKG